MEPSTPPRSSRSRDVPATPATPRFGSFGDLPDHPRKPQANSSSGNNGSSSSGLAAAETPHRRKRSVNILATPRRTPKKRKEAEPAHTRDLHQDADRSLFAKLSAPGPSVKPASLEPSLQIDHMKPIEAKPDSATLLHDQQPPHPHQDAPPPNVPGMWYVFRGKKIFRPFPKGEKPIEPVTLFKDDIDHSRRRKQNDLFQDESDSEADTDMEF